MEKPFIFNFDELLQLDQIYVPEGYFYHPFYIQMGYPKRFKK